MAQVAQNLSPYIGTRQVAGQPQVEYYNAQNQQAFSDPNALASYVNTLNPNAGATDQNVFSLVEKGFDVANQAPPTGQQAGAEAAQLVGQRPSTVDPNVTEYFNKQTGQGFANPQDLSAFVNQQGGQTNANNVFTELQKGFQNAVASGQQAPQSAGAAKSAISSLTPAPNTPKQLTPLAPIEQQLAQDPGYQQLLADRAEFASAANQQSSLLDFYNKSVKEAGIPALNEQLINYKNIIEGTEDDIRNEVRAANGFATESQVLALAGARNKSLIKNYNKLIDQKNAAMENINNMVTLSAQDRQFAMQAISQKLQIDQQLMEYRDKFVQNAKEGYQNIINAVGYNGLYNMLANDPAGLSLAEKNLGLQPGGLQNLTQIIQSQTNLEAIKAAGFDNRFANRGGEIIDAKTGYAFTDPQDFQARTGISLQQAEKQKLISTLGDSLEVQSAKLGIEAKRFDLENAKTNAPLDIALKQAQIANINSEISNRGRVAAAAGPLGLSNQQIDNISPLVTQFQNSPIVQNYNTIGEGYQFVKSLSDSTTNPADDQALIYALAKALDPASVVREGEYATAQKYAQSLVQSYGKSVEQALSGTGFLSTDARKNIKSTIESRFNASQKSYDNLFKETERRVNLIGNTDKGGQLLNNYGGAFGRSGGGSNTDFVGPPLPAGYNATGSGITVKPTTQVGQSFLGKIGNWLWGDK